MGVNERDTPAVVWCRWHSESELRPMLPYRECKGCGHVSPNAAAWEWEVQNMYASARMVAPGLMARMALPPARDVRFCTLCATDF